MKKKIGILGGSFDPVHFGHLNLAIALKESCKLDEVLFVPAGLSPFKENRPPVVSSDHRLAMVKIAIAPIEGFQVLDWELVRKGPSYTIDTVRKLKADLFAELHLLLGEDHLASFHLWKEADVLMSLAPPLVGSRDTQSAVVQKINASSFKIPLFDISSTVVRKRLFQKKYCGHLVPNKVLEYIEIHSLYTECNSSIRLKL